MSRLDFGDVGEVALRRVAWPAASPASGPALTSIVTAAAASAIRRCGRPYAGVELRRGRAEGLGERARDPDAFGRNLITLGDFNIDRWDDPNWRAFASSGLTPSEELLELPRTIFDKPNTKHFYDQIAWFTHGTDFALTLRYTKEAAIVDWPSLVLTDLSKVSASWRISDHFPLWARFALGE